MNNKPKKIIYKNQTIVLNIIKKELIKLFENIPCEVYLVGSSITGEFGKYEKKYNCHEGSDVDLIIFIDEEHIPSEWKYLNTEKNWWKLYRISQLKVNKIEHIVDAMVVKKNQKDYARKRMSELWVSIKIK